MSERERERVITVSDHILKKKLKTHKLCFKKYKWDIWDITFTSKNHAHFKHIKF